MVTPFHETKEFLFGQEGEEYVFSLLKQYGWLVMRCCDYTGRTQGKAPRLEGKRASFILPDYFIRKGQETRWVEVKSKTRPSRFRNDDVLNHGIPHRLYKNYVRVQNETEDPVYLAIFEKYKEDKVTWSGEILIQSLDVLDKNRREGYHKDEGSTVSEEMDYFLRSDFILLGTVPYPIRKAA